MKPLLLTLLLALNAEASVVTSNFVWQVGMRESGMNHRAVGKHGERGAYQIKPIALKDVNQRFGWRYRPSDLHTPAIGERVATGFLVLQEERLRSSLGRQPTQLEVYGAYRWGFEGAKRRARR